MEKMENEYRMLFKQVSPSMVIVEHVGRIGYFCIGSVIHSEGKNTFILTQSRIIDPAEKLSICFSNGCKQSATLLGKLREENLCILMTDFHPKCKAIQVCEDEIDHTYVGTIAPANRSSVYNLHGFIIRKPCEVGCHKHQSLIKGGEDYFIFTSQYRDRSANGVSRLFSAPVFNLRGQALGIAIDDMEFNEWPKKDGKIFHKELYYRYGFSLKVGVTAKRLKELLTDFWGFLEIKVDGTASSSPRAQEGQSPSLMPKKGSPSKKVRSPSPPPKKASPPSKASPPAESAVLCIDHLSRNVNEAHLKEIFGNFGEIVNVELSIDQTVNPPHGYGYIEFKKRADAEKALLYMDGGQIDGNVVKLRFTLQPCQRAALPMKAPPPPPKRDAPPIEKGVSNAEKDAQQRPRESSPRRKPASPPRKRSPNRRAESSRRPPDPSPRRRPDSLPIRRRPEPSPVRRGDTPPPRRPLSPVRRRSPSPPPRRHRSPMQRGRGSPSPRRRSPGPLRRRSPPPRRLRSPPRRRPPPRRYSRSPPCRPLRSRSRSISPRRGRGPPLRRGRSDSSYSRSPTPPPRKGPRRVSRSRSPRRPPRGRSISSDSRSSSSPSPRRGR